MKQRMVSAQRKLWRDLKELITVPPNYQDIYLVLKNFVFLSKKKKKKKEWRKIIFQYTQRFGSNHTGFVMKIWKLHVNQIYY